MRALPLVAALLGLACGRRFFELPPEVGYVAWVELDPSGGFASASPLTRIEDARVWAIDDRPLLFVGFPLEPFADVLARPEAMGWESSPLREARECDVTIEPSWYDSRSELLPPKLTAEWTKRVCRGPGLTTPSCVVCTGDCQLEVTEHALAFDGDVPTNVSLGGLVLVDDVTLLAPLESGVGPSHVAVIEIGDGGPRVTVVRHDDLTPSIAFDGTSAFIGDELGAVVRLRSDGITASRVERVSTGPLLVAAAPGVLLAFEYEGSVFQVIDTSTSAVRREVNPPTFDLALTPSQVIALRPDEIRCYTFDFAIQDRIRLPEPVLLPLGEFEVEDRPRVAIVRDTVLFAAKNTPVYRLRSDESWDELPGWTADMNQPKAFAALDGGTLVGGQRGDAGAQGLLYYERSGIECFATIDGGKVNALASARDESVAWAVTEGPVRPLLLEIRVK